MRRWWTAFESSTIFALALARAASPFADDVPRAVARSAHWVEPRLVVEVRFAGWTGDGRLRHPSFQGVLEDKAAAARLVEHQVLPLVAEGRVRVPVEATFPLEDVHAAYARFEAGSKLGKIVLEMPG